MVHALDGYYLGITALVTLAYQLFFFFIAFAFKFDKVTDLAGGTNFVLLAALTFGWSVSHDARQAVVSSFMMVWGLRLSGFLFFRILKTGKDDRFDEMRQHFFKFLGFWTLQFLWVWLGSLPIVVLNSPNIQAYPQPKFGTGRDIAGVILFVIALVVETWADAQKYRFREANPDKKAFVSTGLYSWSRHPNYFGEILAQFSMFMIAVSPAAYGYVKGQAFKALYATIVGPLWLTVLLLFISGLTLQERPTAKRRYEKNSNYEEYTKWLDSTSIIVPFPSAIYRRLPKIVKQTIFFDLPIYRFDPAKHGDQGKDHRSSEAHLTNGRNDEESRPE